jgi:triosephosphate isomerase
MYKLIINMKTYNESTNKKAVKLAVICKKLQIDAKKKNVELILCPQNIDLRDVVKLKVKTYSQHIDVCTPGANTGFVVPSHIKDCGARGTLISHSEHILETKEISKRIKLAKEIGLETCVCARDVATAKKLAMYNPDFIAVEPSELIGGDISISTANPKLIEQSVRACGSVPLLVGAGVKNGNDVRIAIELGAKGILVASGVVKARNIKKAVADLISGFPEK